MFEYFQVHIDYGCYATNATVQENNLYDWIDSQ